MTGAVEMNAWNPPAVIAGAKELIHASNYEKVGEARKNVDDTIVHWVSAVQQLQTSGDKALHMHGVELVTEIWRLYAALEIELRQFKQATKVFESAVSCPVAGGSKELWLQYAAFCIERKKFSNARKIFVRGLQAVKEQDQDALWTSFHAFVVAHIDPTLSLSTLKAQVLAPESGGGAKSAASTPTGASAAATAVAIAPQQSNAAPNVPPQPRVEPQQIAAQQAPAVYSQDDMPPKSAESIADDAHPAKPAAAVEPTEPVPETAKPEEPVVAIDPALAFVDKTGKTDPPMQLEEVSKKRGIDFHAGPEDSKRTKHDGPRAQQARPKLEIGDTLYFRHIPTVLPLIPECPHLLFDAISEGESQMEIGNELLERLSDVLRDSAVFQGVKDLSDNQRQRDRETLYRWQDLVGMQMKEGSELFARHIDVELKRTSDPRELITIKSQHLEQRREFITRCQMSQQQFIDITGMDRVNALKAQQISLENMKIPEMTVTADPGVIAMQRAILGLILEAEKLWREETGKTLAAKEVSTQPASSAASPVHASRGPAYYPKQQDFSSSSYSNRGGFRGGRGGGYGGRGGPDRQSHYPRTNASHGNRGGYSKRDYDARPTGAAPHASVDHHHHAPRQQLHVRPAYQGQYQQQQPHHQPTQSYGADRSVTLTRDYGNGPPQQQDMSRNAGRRFVGQSMNGASGGGGASAWQQQAPHESRGNDYSHQGSRYGGGPSGSGQLAPPPQAAVSSYANGPKQSRGRSYGAAAQSNMSPPPHQQQYGGYSKFSGAPQSQQHRGGGAPAYHQQQSAVPRSSFQSHDYAVAPQSSSSFSGRNQAPYQQQHQQQQQQQPSLLQQQHHQAAPFQQRGGRDGGGYDQHHQQQMNNHHQTQGYSRGGGGYRRGGGGRYGRR